MPFAIDRMRPKRAAAANGTASIQRYFAASAPAPVQKIIAKGSSYNESAPTPNKHKPGNSPSSVNEKRIMKFSNFMVITGILIFTWRICSDFGVEQPISLGIQVCCNVFVYGFLSSITLTYIDR